MRPFRVAAIAGLIIAVAACNGSSSTSTGDGSFVIVINVPQGGAAAVNIAGPNAYNQNLTATGTLAVIPTGSYVITANPARVGDPIVSQVDTGVVSTDVSGATPDSGKQITVQLNNAVIDTVVVNYRPRPGSGILWTASAGSNGLNRINGFYSVQLAPGGTPGVSVDGGGQGTPGPTAVDPSGNLWVATNLPSIGQYQYGQLLLGTTSGPAGTVITGPTKLPATPLAMAFDPAGDLWVALPGQLIEFSSTGLNMAPALVDTIALLTTAPTGMAFDNVGNLWIAASGTGALIQLSSDFLSNSGGTKTVLSAGVGVVAPVLDAQGRLWVVTTSNTILGFSAQQTLDFTSTTTPAQTVTVSASGNPTTAAFDNSGNLWIAEGAGNTVVELTSTQLQNGGSQAPILSITPPVPNVTGMAFNPKGQFLPLAGSHVAPPVVAGASRRLGHPGA